MADDTRIQEALGQYREMLRVDGADLELAGVDAGNVHVRLVLTPDTCEECILSQDMLEAVILQGMRESDPAITRVVVDDPRVAR
jgi:Fe-S cluster biogenesis protein NfuA